MAPPERDDDLTLRRYLLGTLPEDERERVELEVLRGDAAFEELQAVEDDLYHDYARGTLPDGERPEFERSLLSSPEGPARLAAARALLLGLDAPAPSAAVWRPAWLTLAAAAVLALTLWLLRGEPPAPVRQARQASPPAPSPSTPAPATPSPPPLAGRLLALALSPGAVRSGGPMPRATITPDTTRLRLVLALPEEPAAAGYAAVLRTAEGRTAWSASGLPADAGGRTLTLEPPLEALPEADYELLLSRSGTRGPERLAEYRFRLLRD